jgi:hypothetical protein
VLVPKVRKVPLVPLALPGQKAHKVLQEPKAIQVLKDPLVRLEKLAWQKQRLLVPNTSRHRPVLGATRKSTMSL